MKKNAMLIKNIILAMAIIAITGGPLFSWPTQYEIQTAKQTVGDLFKPKLDDLKAGRVSATDLCNEAIQYVNQTQEEAEKLILLKFAYKMLMRENEYAKAAETVKAMKRVIKDMPDEEIISLVERDILKKGVAVNAPDLVHLFDRAKATADAKITVTALTKKLEKDKFNDKLRKELAEAYIVLNNWPKALEEFSKMLGAPNDPIAKIAKDELKGEGFLEEFADYWWGYSVLNRKAARHVKEHAAKLYQAAIDSGRLRGLKKKIAENRISEIKLANEKLHTNIERKTHDESEMRKTAIEKLQTGLTKTIILPGGSEMEMIYVAPGSFMMGSPEREAKRHRNETLHRVTITKGFWMGKYEVTQQQWESVMGSNPSGFRGDNLPVENVSWFDCIAFVRKVDAACCRQLGGHAHLPTEAQWEYACRAGTQLPYAGAKKSMAWYRSNSEGRSHTVGKKEPNTWGFYDMHGNVWEWCNDLYSTDYYTNSPRYDPQGPISGLRRVFRGGSWSNVATDCRSAYRNKIDPSARINDIGFRLCCSAGPR